MASGVLGLLSGATAQLNSNVHFKCRSPQVALAPPERPSSAGLRSSRARGLKQERVIDGEDGDEDSDGNGVASGAFRRTGAADFSQRDGLNRAAAAAAPGGGFTQRPAAPAVPPAAASAAVFAGSAGRRAGGFSAAQELEIQDVEFDDDGGSAAALAPVAHLAGQHAIADYCMYICIAK